MEKLNIDYKALGKRIKEQRLKKDKTQEQLSEMVGLSVNHIAHIECGSTKLSMDAMVKICNALEVTPDAVLFDSISSFSDPLKDEITILLGDCSEKNLVLIKEMIKTIKKVQVE